MTQIIDADIIIRLLTKDNPSLFSKAKLIFEAAESGKTNIYLDEIVLAETIWVLLSHYHFAKHEICPGLLKLLSYDWVINPRKSDLLGAISMYSEKSFSFIDCWLWCLAKNKNLKLETNDK